MTIDVVRSLPLLRWRGLSAPCTESPFEGGHEQAPRAYPYVDAESHDHTGRRSDVVRATLVFNNSIEADLFPTRLRKWLDALRNGEPGTLEHPVLGNFTARVLAWAGSLTAGDRGGVTLQVTWCETLLDPTEPSTFTVSNVSPQATAKAADDAMAALNIDFPTGLGFSSLLDAIQSIEGELFSASLTFRSQVAKVDSVFGAVLDLAEAQTSVDAWPLIDTLEMLQAYAQDKQRAAVARTRKTAAVRVESDTALDSFAARVGNAFEDVLELNLDKLRSPIVKRGATLLYYVTP